MTRRRDPEPEAGIALVVTLLFGLALVLLAHAALVLARSERWMAAREGSRLEGERSQRAAVLHLVGSVDSLPAPGTHDTPYGGVEVAAPGTELRVGASVPGTEPGRAGSIRWLTVLAAPLHVPRVVSREAAIRVGGTVWSAAGAVAAGMPGDACPPEVSAAPHGVGPLVPGDTLPRLGPLELGELVARLPALATDRLDLAPDTDPACGEPGSFGDPARPGTCPGDWGAASRVGALRLAGSGQGVLAVTGDLVVSAGAVFRGWLWVGGTLRLEGDALVIGLVDAGGDLSVPPGARVVTDPCAGSMALAAAPSLARPVPVGPAVWPGFRP